MATVTGESVGIDLGTTYPGSFHGSADCESINCSLHGQSSSCHQWRGLPNNQPRSGPAGVLTPQSVSSCQLFHDVDNTEWLNYHKRHGRCSFIKVVPCLPVFPASWGTEQAGHLEPCYVPHFVCCYMRCVFVSALPTDGECASSVHNPPALALHSYVGQEHYLVP